MNHEATTVRRGTARATLSRCREYIDRVLFRCDPPDESESHPVLSSDRVGIELEMIPVSRLPPGRPGVVSLTKGRSSLTSLLRPAARDNGWRWVAGKAIDPERSSPCVERIELEHGRITFEPGAQLEFSGSPFPSLALALQRLVEFQEVLRSIADPGGVELLQIGFNPWHTVAEIGLQLTKRRYVAMDAYFPRRGPYGRRMMRQSCSIQVNLDWGPDEDTLVKRYLAAQLLAPFATAIFANSPFRDGRRTRLASFRSFTWKRMDPSRTGFPDLRRITERMTREACVESYLEFAMGAPVIYVESPDGKVPGQPGTLIFADWMSRSSEGSSPTLADFETHLSLLFPEARPRGFMELRSVDCPAVPWQAVPPAFFAGLLYDGKALDQLIALLLPFQDELDRVWREAALGLEVERVRSASQQLMALASEGLANLPPSFGAEQAAEDVTRFRAVFTERGRCPADDLRDAWESSSELRLPMIKEVEARWAGHG